MSGKPPSAAEELREATREANAAVKDLRAVLREVAAAEASVRGAMQEEVEARVDEEFSEYVAEFTSALEKEMALCSQAAQATFDRVEQTFLRAESETVVKAVRDLVLREMYQLIREAGDRGDPKAFLRDMNAAAQAR